MTKRLLPITLTAALAVPAALIGSPVSASSENRHTDDLKEILEEANEDLNELRDEFFDSPQLKEARSEVDRLIRGALADHSAGEYVNVDRVEDSVEEMVDRVEDFFKKEDSGDDHDGIDEDDRDDSDDSDDSDDRDGIDEDDRDDSDDRDGTDEDDDSDEDGDSDGDGSSDDHDENDDRDGETAEELKEILEEVSEELDELRSEFQDSQKLEETRTEVDRIVQEALAAHAAGERVNVDRIENSVEKMVDHVEDFFRQEDSDDDVDESDDDDDSDEDGDSDGDDSDEELEDYRADIEEITAKATLALDAAADHLDADVVASARAVLADLVERASATDLTPRQAKVVRNEIRELYKRFKDYHESTDDGDGTVETEKKRGFERVAQAMEDSADRFADDEEKYNKFVERRDNFVERFEEAKDDDERREVAKKHREDRIKDAHSSVTALIDRIIEKLGQFDNYELTPETADAVAAMVATLERISSSASTAETREDLKEVRDAISAERTEIGRLFLLLEDLKEDAESPSEDLEGTDEAVEEDAVDEPSEGGIEVSEDISDAEEASE